MSYLKKIAAPFALITILSIGGGYHVVLQKQKRP